MARMLLPMLAAMCSLMIPSTSAQADTATPASNFEASKPHKHVPSYYHAVVVTHAVIACLAWVIFFPSGLIAMRLLPCRYAFKAHTYAQVFGVILYIAGTGMGIWMGKTTWKLAAYHSIIGLVVFALMALQVVAGSTHHWILYKRYLRRTTMSRFHLWLGRVLVTLGMINGGLGFKLASGDGKYGVKIATKGELAAYGVICGVFWLAYVLVVTKQETKAMSKQSSEQNSVQGDSYKEAVPDIVKEFGA